LAPWVEQLFFRGHWHGDGGFAGVRQKSDLDGFLLNLTSGFLENLDSTRRLLPSRNLASILRPSSIDDRDFVLCIILQFIIFLDLSGLFRAIWQLLFLKLTSEQTLVNKLGNLSTIWQIEDGWDWLSLVDRIRWIRDKKIKMKLN